MLTRRFFAQCALCAIGGFAATEVNAQGAAPAAATNGVSRVIVQRSDGPAPGFETILVTAEIAAGAKVARHTHPGIESSYLLTGGGELLVDGQAARTVKPGDTYLIATGAIHALNNGAAVSTVSTTYIVEKGKPLASPAA